MGTSSGDVAMSPTFEELHRICMVPPIDWNLYSSHTRLGVDTTMRELLEYDKFYWTTRIESLHLWEERLGGEGLNYGHELELKHQYYDFFCCKLDGKELACKESILELQLRIGRSPNSHILFSLGRI